MKIEGIHLAWVVVDDFHGALKFYTEVVGLQVTQLSAEHGWAELSGEDGSVLGISENSAASDIKPGQSAVVTLSVTDILQSRQELLEKGTELVGEIIEVPGHVKMQTFRDPDGNVFQLVESLDGDSE